MLDLLVGLLFLVIGGLVYIGLFDRILVLYKQNTVFKSIIVMVLANLLILLLFQALLLIYQNTNLLIPYMQLGSIILIILIYNSKHKGLKCQ